MDKLAPGMGYGAAVRSPLGGCGSEGDRSGRRSQGRRLKKYLQIPRAVEVLVCILLEEDLDSQVPDGTLVRGRSGSFDLAFDNLERSRARRRLWCISMMCRLRSTEECRTRQRRSGRYWTFKQRARRRKGSWSVQVPMMELSEI